MAGPCVEHVAVRVRDFEAALAFFTDVMGMATLRVSIPLLAWARLMEASPFTVAVLPWRSVSLRLLRGIGIV